MLQPACMECVYKVKTRALFLGFGANKLPRHDRLRLGDNIAFNNPRHEHEGIHANHTRAPLLIFLCVGKYAWPPTATHQAVGIARQEYATTLRERHSIKKNWHISIILVI